MKLPTAIAALLATHTISSSHLGTNAFENPNHVFTASGSVRRLRTSKGRNLRERLFHHHHPENETSPSFLPKIFGNLKVSSSLLGSRSRSRSLQDAIGWKLIGDEINADAYYDRAGDAVAINADGTRVAFGAYKNRGGRGHVKIFDYDAGSDTWSQVGSSISGLSGDESGSSISMSDSGDVIAIGAPNHSNYLGTTRVYSYDPDLDRWTTLGVDIDGLKRGDKNGESVSISGDGKRLAIGGDEAGADFNGYARVFEFNGGSWVQVGQTLNGVDAYYGKGSTVALNTDGTRLIVSSDLKPLGNLRLVGGVDVYRYDATSSQWIAMGQSFRGSAYYDLFGDSADINAAGDRIVIGVTNHDPTSPGKNAGMVQVYQYVEDGDEWLQVGKDIYGIESQDGFGVAVSMDGSGNRIMAGAAKADTAILRNNGEARVFEYDAITDDWVQLGNTIYGECGNDEAGRAVDISRDGNHVVVGAPLNWYYSGHIRIFEAVPGHEGDIDPTCYTFSPRPTPPKVPTPSPTGNPTETPTSQPTVSPSGLPSSTPSIKIIEYSAFGEAKLESTDIAFCAEEDSVRNSLISALSKVSDDSTEIDVLGGVETNCPTERRLQGGDDESYYFSFTVMATKSIPEAEFVAPETVEEILDINIDTITNDVNEEMEKEIIIEVTNIENPSASPTSTPSFSPSGEPSVSPSSSPSVSSHPSVSPSKVPTTYPSKSPSAAPSNVPSSIPSATPSDYPTSSPSSKPSNTASNMPSSTPSAAPSYSPTSSPSSKPSTTVSDVPSLTPSITPSGSPTYSPSSLPSAPPSESPSGSLSEGPSVSPSNTASSIPTALPSTPPTSYPSTSPTASPTKEPTSSPSASPTGSPSKSPSTSPTKDPTLSPSAVPTSSPTPSPTASPTKEPTSSPSASPTGSPSKSPSTSPTKDPTLSPSAVLTSSPTPSPTASPTKDPTASPTKAPTSSSASTANLAFTIMVATVTVAAFLYIY